jgi:hypothetical protein
VDNLGSTRIVKFLIIRGADITIRDNKSRLPASLIAEIKDKKMRDELFRAMVILIYKSIIIGAPRKIRVFLDENSY